MRSLLLALLGFMLSGCGEDAYFKDASRSEVLARVVSEPSHNMTQALNAPRGVWVELSVPGNEKVLRYFDADRFAAFAPVSNTPVCVLYAQKGDRARVEKAWFPHEAQFKEHCGYGKSFDWHDI